MCCLRRSSTSRRITSRIPRLTKREAFGLSVRLSSTAWASALKFGLNFYDTRSSEPDDAELQPNAKWQFYSDEESGLAAAAGGILFIPLKNRATTNTKVLLYATLSQQVKRKYGPRFTAGAYSFVGRMEEGENRAGILLGYEQPVHSQLIFFTDWYSGNNSFGYAAAGIGITLPKEQFLYAGYSFGNQGRGNNWLGIFFQPHLLRA